MKRITDARGFIEFDMFKCMYGTKIRVKESSAAASPHIWIFMDEDLDIFPDAKPGSASAHLSLEQVDRLIIALQIARTEHYQLRKE